MPMQPQSQPNPKSEPKITLDELKTSNQDGEACDREIFAEMRSNILLVAGEHYNRKSMKEWTRQVRDSKDLNQEQKLRLTKNHMYKIMRGYANAVTSYAPGVAAAPQNPLNLQDVKAADLHQKVMKYSKHKYRMREKVRNWGDDYTVIGEVGCKIFFDPNLGKQVGVEQKTTPEGVSLFLDEFGQETDQQTDQPAPGDRPVYSGDFVFETFYGFNMIRPQEAKSAEEAEWLEIRKMADLGVMRKKYADDVEKLKAFKETQDGTYLIFDPSTTSYGKSSKNQVMILERYYRPCMKYPNGYYVFWTEHGIFEEGELPFGIFPIAFAAFDRYQTSPRGRSHIKILRPFQVEINRASSKLAEHQVTLGDDKIITQAGTTITEGTTLPGIRGYQVTGAEPKVLPGRDGSHFAKHVQEQIGEMYRASLVDEETKEQSAQLDPYTMLFRAASQKKKFNIYTERFEQYLIDVWTIYLELARRYMPDAELLEAVGEEEGPNLSEFRNPKKLCYILQLEPQSDDVESKIGRQITMMQALQYSGDKLTREDIGKFIKNMPYANIENDFEDFTLDYEAATNVVLALDRGQDLPPHPSDDHAYMLKRLTNRTRKGDFMTMKPEVQQAYAQRIDYHQNQEAMRLQKVKAMEADMIPTTGGLIGCDMYIDDPKNPLASRKRVRVPGAALQWLIDRLTDQGSALQRLEQVHDNNLLEIAAKAGIGQGQGGPPGDPPQQPVALNPA